MSGGILQQQSSFRQHARKRSLARRVGKMVLVWLCFGVCVGMTSSAAHNGIVGLVSGAIAGMLVFPWLGLVLGLLGAAAEPVLLLGVSGILLGGLVGEVTGQTQVVYVADVGLISGGLIGATAPVLLSGLKRLLFAVLPLHTQQ